MIKTSITALMTSFALLAYADRAKVSVVEEVQTITVASDDPVDYAPYAYLVVDGIDAVNKAKSVEEICQSISSIDYSNASPHDMIRIMEAAMAKLAEFKVNPVSAADEQNRVKYDNWYEMTSFAEGGTGIYAVMKTAQHKAKNGEDISDLFQLFIKMLKDESK